MGRCRRTEPYREFAKAIPNEFGTWETKQHIYTKDGLFRIKKTGQMQDKARRYPDVLEEIRKKVQR